MCPEDCDEHAERPQEKESYVATEVTWLVQLGAVKSEKTVRVQGASVRC